MKSYFILPLLALAGLLFAAVAVVRDNRETIPETPPLATPVSPYSSFIAGTGIVETALGNIAIGSPVTGVVTDICVRVGDEVESGDPLFRVDDRDVQARLATARVKVKEAEAALQIPRDKLAFSENLAREDPAAVSQQTLTALRDQVKYAQAALELTRAGVRQLETELELHTVEAPAAGRILKMKLRPGEFVDSARATAPLLLFGANERLNVRVDIDETQGWRFAPGAQATAFVRGNPRLEIPLRYEYMEPYVVPRTALSGQVTERTDRRVLQAVYSFGPGDFPVYVGQQLDVYISAPPTVFTSGDD